MEERSPHPGRRQFRSGAPGPAVEAGPAPLGPMAPGEDRILTVPNVITLLRLACLPVFVWLLLGVGNRFWAACLLAGLGATDWVDGFVARRFNQGSRFGRLFDPTADRLLFFVALVAILIDGGIPRWFVIAVLVREVVVATITVTILVLGAPPVDVTWWGKAGTFGLMVAFPLLLGSAQPGLWGAGFFNLLGWLAAIPGFIISLVAFVRYLPLWREAWREGRVLRAQRQAQAASSGQAT